MKVFNLACEQDHRFEGWFASSDDFDSQLSGGLLTCPMCDSQRVRKLPAAPRLNLSQATAPRERAAPEPAKRGDARTERQPAALADPAQMQALLMKMARYIVENSEDVGERFAEEARKIHESQAPERSIRGTATREQIGDLLDDGIEVFSFPLPRSLKEPLQ